MTTVRDTLHRLVPPPLRRSIGARVITGFGLTAALAIAVGTVSLIHNNDAGRSLARVSERDREVSSDFRELEVAVEQQSGAVQSFLLSGDDRDLDTLRAGRERFSAALDRLEEALPTRERGEAFAELRRQAQAIDEVAQEEIALYRQGWGRSANYLWRTDGQQIRQRLLDAVNRQIQVHNAAIDADLRSSRDHLRLALAVSVALVALAAVLAFAVGIGITRAVTRPVKHLMRVTGAVGAGDLSERAPIVGEDQMAVLSSAVNAMVDNLAVSRAAIEHALAESERSEQKYRLLTEKANDIIFTLDRENRFTFVNAAAVRVLGYEPEELLGRSAEDLYSDGTRQMVAKVAGWVSTPPYTFNEDVEVRARDGRMVLLQVNSTVLFENGHASGIHGVARDMTERYRMEQELRRLHGQERRRADQLTTVNEIGRKIATLQPVDTLLPSLARMLGRTFGYHHVRILLAGEGGALAVAGFWSGRADGDGEPEGPATSPVVDRALSGEAGFVAHCGAPVGEAEGWFSELAVPVRTGGQVTGVIDVRGEADGLDEGDLFTLQTVADQVSVAIENARLYEAGRRLAVSEERNRLARDLHDSVTQELFSMTMIAGALPTLMERKPDVARERLVRLHDLARGALSEMRALLFALRPAALEEEGLVSALRKYAAAFSHREGVTVNLECDTEDRLPNAVEEALYRVAQEALNNVAKHAGATVVDIHLSLHDAAIELTIHDDGTGLDPVAVERQGTLGMTSMRERTTLVGGQVTIEGAPGEGTTVSAVVPLHVAAPVPMTATVA